MSPPEYVEYGSLATVAGPLVSTGSNQWVFPLEADRDNLAAICRRCFTEPSGGAVDIRPLGRHILFSIGRIERLVSQVPPFDRMGWAAEGQAAIWIPVVRVKGAVAEEILMFTPYMWVDNPMSLPSGREMYGYPKAWGWMELDPPASFALDVFGMDYGRDEEAARRPLLRVTAAGDPPVAEHAAWTELADAVRHLRDVIEVRPGVELLESLAAAIRGGGLRQIFLHQVRSAEDGTRAALQQVVAARYRVLRLRGGSLGHEFSLTVAGLDSHPLGNDLGVADQVVRHGFHSAADFELEAGEVLWDAAGRGGK